MIKNGLKLWSNNINLFSEAVELCEKKVFDYIEIYHNSQSSIDYEALSNLKKVNVLGVHIGDLVDAKFHDFFLTSEQQPVWESTIKLADFFNANYILVHPARLHNLDDLFFNLKKMNDKRIVVENMPGFDIYSRPMNCGVNKKDLQLIRNNYPILFDFEKALKSSTREKVDYKNFVKDCLLELSPVYFHISGGHTDVSIDEHTNLWDSDIDIGFIKNVLGDYAEHREVYLAFETPKIGENIENDIKNIDYFKANI